MNIRVQKRAYLGAGFRHKASLGLRRFCLLSDAVLSAQQSHFWVRWDVETLAAAFLSVRARESGFAERISLTGARKPPAVPGKEPRSSRAWPSAARTTPRLDNSHLGGKGEKRGPQEPRCWAAQEVGLWGAAGWGPLRNITGLKLGKRLETSCVMPKAARCQKPPFL